MKRKNQAVSKVNTKQLHQCWSWNQCWSHTVLILEPTCQKCAAGSPPTALDLSYQCPRKSQTSAKPSFSLDFNFEREVLLSPQQSKAFLLNSLRLWVLSNISLIALIRRFQKILYDLDLRILITLDETKRWGEDEINEFHLPSGKVTFRALLDKNKWLIMTLIWLKPNGVTIEW